MKDNPVAKNAHKFNKRAAGPHKDKKRALKKGERKHKGSYESVEEKLSASDGVAAWIKDFQQSDAPQFAGKSAEKRKEMALAAYLDAKKGSKEEACWQGYTQKGMKKKGDRVVPNCVPEETNEDLRKWFGKGKKGDWVRVGTDGEIKGDCARDPGEGKPKCMPRDKAHSMSKKDRGSAARRKRAKDPTVDRPGTGNKPIMVKTDKKESFEVKYKGLTYTATGKKGTVKGADASEYRNKSGGQDRRVWRNHKTGELIPESIQEKNEPTNPKLWAKFKAQAKAKFDVYPSAYANGWAAKQYKAAGGGWKTVKESAQDRLDRMAKKHGLGKPNKAADDYMAKMRKKYGAKDDADLKRKMGMKEGKYPTSRKPKVVPAPKSDMAKRMARGQRNDPMNKIGVKKESTAAYGKSQSNIRRKQKHAGMTSSDRNKMGKVADMMRKEREKKIGVKKESMDPRDFTDKAGFLVTSKGRGKEEIKQFFNTKPAAQKYAHKVNQGGNKATIYKTDGRKMMKEEDVNELSTKTLGSYISKASDARGHKKLSTAKQDKRYAGVDRASRKMDKKLSGESVEENQALKKLLAIKKAGGTIKPPTTADKQSRGGRTSGMTTKGKEAKRGVKSRSIGFGSESPSMVRKDRVKEAYGRPTSARAKAALARNLAKSRAADAAAKPGQMRVKKTVKQKTDDLLRYDRMGQKHATTREETAKTFSEFRESLRKK